jgi:plastocyanin
MRITRMERTVRRFGRSLGAVLGAVAMCGLSPASAAEGGATLRGVITYKGPVPPPRPLEVDHDMECCAKSPILPETLLVSKDGQVREGVVWLEGVKGDKPWPAKPVALDQQGCVFQPHVAVVGVGQPMNFLNSDPIIHNIHTWPRENDPMSVSQLAKGLGRPIKRTFTAPDEIKVTCDVHKWMGAWVIVRDNPYYAITGPDGGYEITDIPPGTYTMVVWHESLERVERKVKLDAGTPRVENVEMKLK